MPADYTATALIAQVRRRAMLPTADAGMSDADVLAFLNDELNDYITPLLIQVGEEYLVAVKDVAITPGEAEYAIPDRAVGLKVRDVQVQSGGDWVSLPRIEPEDVVNFGSGDTPAGFYLQGNKVVLVPSAPATSALRFKYYRRPSMLVTSGYTESRGGPVPFGSMGEYLLPVVSITPISSVTVFDFLDRGYPFSPRFDSLVGVPLLDPLGDGTFGPAVSVPADISSLGASPRLYVTREGESPVPQIPAELVTLLVQRTAARILESLGDRRYEGATAMANDIERRAIQFLSPRSEGKGRTVVNYNAAGWGRGSLWRWRG